MSHAANGIGPFASDIFDSAGTWDDGLDDIDESLMLDVEGTRVKTATSPKSPIPTNNDYRRNSHKNDNNYNDIMSPDEARRAGRGAVLNIRAARMSNKHHLVDPSFSFRLIQVETSSGYKSIRSFTTFQFFTCIAL